jgi:hypothetical protein
MRNVGTSNSTDAVALSLWKTLISDFRTVEGPNFAQMAEKAFDAGIQEFREYQWPTLGSVDVFRFKAYRQLEQLFKRHVFANDKMTTTDRADATLIKFHQNNQRLQSSLPQSLSISLVIREARRLNREILGNVDHDELITHAKIGSRATLGGPLRDAYIDCKLGVPKQITCPSILRTRFFDILEGDALLKSIVRKAFKTAKKANESLPLDADSLDLVLVPKSWKVERPITPLSLIGLYWSYGVGGAVTARLKDNRMDISTLQQKHKRWAKRYSETQKHVTADLSSASDSLTAPLLNALLPRAWYNVLKQTFVRNLRINGTSFYTNSVLPMGNAATFPVETLIFYSLIKAIGNLLKVRGNYSVYGDDLIYPTRIHPFVVKIFTALGLLINGDKTFVNSEFRESCGGDYYRGCDVRPALLPFNSSPFLKGLRYQQYLYKLLNALLTRWDREEIPSTCAWLESELIRVSRGNLHLVPKHYPPTSGLQVDNPEAYVYWVGCTKVHRSNWDINCLPIKQGCSFVTFKAIMSTGPNKRPILSSSPYYWDWLRSAQPEIRGDKLNRFTERYEGWHEGIKSPLVFELVRRDKKRHFIAFTPLKEEGRPRVQVSSTFGWKTSPS